MLHVIPRLNDIIAEILAIEQRVLVCVLVRDHVLACPIYHYVESYQFKLRALLSPGVS